MRRSALLAVFAVACSRGATIEGDVYNVTGQGQPARAAGALVALVTPPDTFDVRICIRYYQQSGDLIQRSGKLLAQLTATGSYDDPRRVYLRALEDSLSELARETRTRLSWRQAKAIVDSQTTRIDAHFEFDGVQPGNYLLVATAPNTDGEWRRAVSVTGGQRLVADLGPPALRSDNEFCSGEDR